MGKKLVSEQPTKQTNLNDFCKILQRGARALSPKRFLILLLFLVVQLRQMLVVGIFVVVVVVVDADPALLRRSPCPRALPSFVCRRR